MLGQAIEHVAQHIHVVRQGKFHHLKFFRIQQMAEWNRMPDETMERFCDRCFSRRIDQQLRHVIREIVARRSMHAPVPAQRFRASEDLFRQHVDGAPVFRQRNPERFCATLLKFFEIFARQVEAVGMIDAESGHRACAHQIQK